MRRSALALLIAALGSTACAASSAPMSPRASRSADVTPSQPAPRADDTLRAPPGDEAPGAPQAPSPQPAAAPLLGVDRPADGLIAAPDARLPMLIYTGTLHVAVLDTSAALTEAERIAAELGGYLARRDDRSVTLRLPVARFSDGVARATRLGDVLHRDVSAQDVTEEYADLEVRVKNARAVRDRLEHLLAKAATIQDSIQLERELARVTADLERLEGKAKLMRDRAAFSTLTVRFEPRKTDAPPGAPKRPHLPLPWVDSLGLGKLLSL